MNIKLTHPNAILPLRAHDTDAGWDLYVADVKKGFPYQNQIWYDFGVAFDIPKGWVGLVFPRSSVGAKMDLTLSNCVGVIDSGYTGSVKAIFDTLIRDWARFSKSSKNSDGFAEEDTNYTRTYKVGDRAAQIVFLPLADVQELTVVEDFDKETSRGSGGFGSSGE